VTADPRHATPTEVRKQGGARVRITWADGHASEYPAHYLRARCPCAACVDEDTGRRQVGEGDVRSDVAIEKLDLVGNYALQIRFSDGHATGLYSFDSLRRICGCGSCAGV
jgi:DUF971 family protein